MMDSVKATMLQIVGLTFEIHQEGKVSQENMKFMNTLTDSIGLEVDKLTSRTSSLEKDLIASQKNGAVLKRKLNEASSKVRQLNPKIQSLEQECSDLDAKCKRLEDDLDSSWVGEISFNAEEDSGRHISDDSKEEVAKLHTGNNSDKSSNEGTEHSTEKTSSAPQLTVEETQQTAEKNPEQTVEKKKAKKQAIAKSSLK